jgi:hypothetical protein
MKTLNSAALVALLGLAACTPSTVGGVRGATAFAATAHVENHDSRRSATEVFECFRATAKFLPPSRFTANADGSHTYTLAGFGLWFEEVIFTPGPDGSHVSVRTSGAYDDKWIAMLARDRLEPLGACLNPPQKTGAA